MQVNSSELSDYEARGRIEKFSAIFSLVILGLTICLLGLSIYGLFDVDETRYAASAVEMVRSGNYLVPTFNGEPRMDHPIFYYWLLAGFFQIFGFSPGSFRLVSALFAFGLIMAVGRIVHRESRVEGGFLAGVILATSSFFAYMARVAVADMVFSFFLFLSSFLLYMGTFDAKKVDRLMIRAGVCIMALAFITKGIAGAILPLLCLFLFSWLNGRLKRMVSALADWKALVLFFLIALPWYVALYLRMGPEFFHAYIGESIGRMVSASSDHRGPIYYYIPVVFLGMFPWSLFLPQTFFSILKERGFSLKAVGENISLDMFLLLFSCVIFIYFSLSSEKVATYILSIFPALAIMVGLFLEKVILREKVSDLGLVTGAYAYSICCVLLAILMIYPKEYFPVISEAGLSKLLFYPGMLLLVGAFFVGIFTVFRKNVKRVRVKIFAAMLIPQLLFLWFVFFAVLPGVYEYRQSDLQKISRFLNKAEDKDSPVIFYRKFKPSVVYFTGKKVHSAKSFEDVVAYTSNRKNAYVIFPGADPSVKLTSLGTVSGVYRGKLYSLYKVRLK